MKTHALADVRRTAKGSFSEDSKLVKEIRRNGISVRIRPTVKDGTTYFVLDYRVQGQRKLVWRSTMAGACAAADDAIDKITAGQGEVLELTSADAHAYTRARTAPLPHG